MFADGGALFFALYLCFLPPLSKKRCTKAPLSEDAERLRQCQEKVYGGGRFSRAAMPFGGREYVPFVNFLVFPVFH